MATKGTLRFKKYMRRDPQDKEADPMWYGKAAPGSIMEFDALVDHINGHNSPYSKGVIAGVLKDMLDCVKELVLDGKTVRLGDLGLFFVGIKSKPAVTKEDWKASTHIKGVKLNVLNTKTWSNSELRKLCTFEEMGKYNGGEEISSNAPEDEEGAAD